MIPAGISYPGLRVISPMHTPSMAGAVLRNQTASAMLGRVGFAGLGSTRDRACTAFSVIDAGGQTALAAWNQAKTDPKYGTTDPKAQAIGTSVTALASAIGGALCPTPPAPIPAGPPPAGGQQIDAIIAQNNAMLSALAQQQAAAAQQPPPPAAGIDKQTLLIGGAIAAGLVALLVLRR
jgi:hypothetical protein